MNSERESKILKTEKYSEKNIQFDSAGLAGVRAD